MGVCGGLGLSYQMLILTSLHLLDLLIRSTTQMYMKCESGFVNKIYHPNVYEM
ncbi:hypothetical protein QJS04_geneDACA018127 [Acorus gramineus]|uniref:Uncharacterized protein n=1 Tax=Acorus gramineus TaxID=55184 RepID=A0AAV9AJU1_ACOGR|nr:hypothetical protein QJS04_geneDACA018127 [Acorus gramineus]